MLQPVRREKKCRACTARFVPTRPLQVACCPECALALAQRNRIKAETQNHTTPVSHPDTVVVLDYGRKIGDGTPDDVRRNQTVIDAYLGVAH